MSSLSDALPLDGGGASWGGLITDGTGVSRLLQEVCHDLIEPAATIKILAETAYADADPVHAARRCLRLISREAAMIADICGYVLGRTRPVGPVRLDQLAAQQVESARARYRTAVEIDSVPVSLPFQPAVFMRVIGNLLANACQAAGPDGLVRLAITLDGEWARFSVDDSGPGLPGRRSERTSFGLDIVWSLVLDCRGMVEMAVSDLGGLHVAVSFPCPPQIALAVAPAKDVRPGTDVRRDRADMTA